MLHREDKLYVGDCEPLTKKDLKNHLPKDWWGYYGDGRDKSHLQEIAEYYGTLISLSWMLISSDDMMAKYFVPVWSERAFEWLSVKSPDHIDHALTRKLSYTWHVAAVLIAHKSHWVDELNGGVALKLGDSIYVCPPPFISTLGGRMHALQEPAIRWVDWHSRKVVAYMVAANNRIVDVRYYNGSVDGIKLWETTDDVEYASAAINIMLARQDVDRCLQLEEVDRKYSRSGSEQEEIILYRSVQKVRQIVDGVSKMLPLHLVRIVCPSTGRVYYIPVEPKYSCALEAIKSTQPPALRALRPNDDYWWDVAT
ncbi:MAG: hypothetical protein KatS3mg054_0028 [Chloroflexus sp.]|nr:MAG: hypothetical protein KatS3mg054_0028 [Chloroflexus sp.]